MANMALVDTDKLNSDMFSLAEKIRAKGNTTEKLEWPVGYETAIDALKTETILPVISDSGKFDTDDNGEKFIKCDFKPDIVLLWRSSKSTYVVACPFSDFSYTKLNVALWDSYSDGILDIYMSRTTDGFNVEAYIYTDLDTDPEPFYDETFYYKAYKFTT